MVLQREKKPPVTSHATDVQVLTGAVEVVEGKQPGIALRIGTALDPGIERKLRPNEDTLSVTRGLIPAASPKPFVLLIVADGMGGQGHGQQASRLAVQSLVEYVSGSLCSKQTTPQYLSRFARRGCPVCQSGGVSAQPGAENPDGHDDNGSTGR